MKLRVLVACEFSGTVRNAFRAAGHDAWSCDLEPDEGYDPSKHLIGDVQQYLRLGWDLMIAHPPCTDLAVSGARWFKTKQDGRIRNALDFVASLMNARVPHIAIENPVSIISTHLRRCDQVIHPWQFGHGEVKTTCLWLKNLPPLKPTNIVEGREERIHKMPPSPNRSKERSRTYAGIAEAMADQWGRFCSVPLAL